MDKFLMRDVFQERLIDDLKNKNLIPSSLPIAQQGYYNISVYDTNGNISWVKLQKPDNTTINKVLSTDENNNLIWISL